MPSPITVAVPMYGAVPDLTRCLSSIVNQSFHDIEILVIDDSDCQDCRAQGQVHRFLNTLPQNQKYRIHYIRHKSNMGCFEARRTAALHANGTYILYVDSDDELASPDACRILYETAIAYDSDMIIYSANLKGIADKLKEQDRLALEAGITHTFFDGNTSLPIWYHLFIKKTLPTLWFKCIRRQVLLDAFNEIPQLYCFNKEDLVISFFLSLFVKKYTVIDDKLYNYYIGGETSAAGKKTIKQWSNMCSASSGFTAMLLWLRDHQGEKPEYAELDKVIKPMYFSAIRECLTMYDLFVTPDEQDEVMAIINDSWGEKVVANVRRAMAEKQH